MTEQQPGADRLGPDRPILVGVVPGQPLILARRAAELAHGLGVELVCAYVDVATFRVAEGIDGALESQAIDPDGVDDDIEDIATNLRELLAPVFAPYGIRWSFRVLAGDPARALGRLAHTLNAVMIVVGTREGGRGHRLEEILSGSIAVHLSHRQSHPVLVVPLDPRPLPAPQKASGP